MNTDRGSCSLTKERVKRALTAFAQFVVTSILRTCFQVVVFGCDSFGEFLDLILVSFLIGALVEMVVAFIKKGAKIMRSKFRRTLDRIQKPKVNNKTRYEAKVGSEWVN